MDLPPGQRQLEAALGFAEIRGPCSTSDAVEDVNADACSPRGGVNAEVQEPTWRAKPNVLLTSSSEAEGRWLPQGLTEVRALVGRGRHVT
jgi:hypothetical protein